MADLPENVQNSRTLRDILKKDSIRQQQEKFYQRAENEKKLLLSVGHVTGRTTFDKTISLEINPIPCLSYHERDNAPTVLQRMLGDRKKLCQEKSSSVREITR